MKVAEKEVLDETTKELVQDVMKVAEKEVLDETTKELVQDVMKVAEKKGRIQEDPLWADRYSWILHLFKVTFRKNNRWMLLYSLSWMFFVFRFSEKKSK